MQQTSTKDNNKRSTGIGGLDYTLDGGLPLGTSIVAYGSPLSGLDLMAKQFWKTEEEQGVYLMMDATPETDMIDILEVPLEKLGDLMQGERIVVDSLSSLVLKYGIDAVIQFMTSGIREILARKANVFFVVYSDLHSPMEEMRILRAADNVMQLRQNIHGNEVERSLALFKIKGTAVPDRVVPFIITDKGIELSTTSRVV